MKIIWSYQAQKMYELIIDDLLKKWPIEITLDFEYRTNNLLNHLKEHKHLCPKSKHKKLHKCVIHKNVSLIYKVNRKNIEIVTLIFNRDNHKYY